MCTLKHTDVSNLKSANLRFITLLLDAFQSLGSSVCSETYSSALQVLSESVKLCD